MNKHEPYEKLSHRDQALALDVTVLCSVLVTRLPALNDLILSAIANEFALQCHLPKHTAAAALRSLGQTLFETAWRCDIAKNADKVISTQFEFQEPTAGGQNGA